MMIQRLTPSVKTLQHPKALANARQVVRGTYRLMYADAPDLNNAIPTPFGVEKTGVVRADFNLDSSTSEFIIGAGRLEPIPEEMKVLDSRIAEKEAYRLFWLPYDYETGIEALERWKDASQAINDDFLDGPNTSMVELVPGVRLWMVVKGSPSPTVIDDYLMAEAFIVVQNVQLTRADVLEFEATVVKDLSTPARRVTLQ